MNLPTLWPLPLFPEGSLASSIITTVWVGVAVVCFFNLRFGWVLSGLVVPGYMVPLWMIKPGAAVVTTLEGLLTYGIVWLLSERLSRFNLWNAFFGRDRFFAILLAAVGVRIGVDGVLLPAAAQWLSTQGYGALDYQNNLQSFGLVVSALIANQLWKPGLVRGLGPLMFTTLITYALVLGLTLCTNFSVGTIHYLYEDIAGSIEASPKFYIVLLGTAMLASRLNLNYSWDFNGIMVPALLTLQWYQPSKIVATLVEAWVILVLARLALKSPWLAQINVEGARKLLLFFNVGFAYKLVLGFVAPTLGLAAKTSDFFAYGYLMSTLLAMRMHDKSHVLQLPRVVLQTSLTALVLASVVGYGLSKINLDTWIGDSAVAQSPSLHPPRPAGNATERLYDELTDWHEAEAQDLVLETDAAARLRLRQFAATLAQAGNGDLTKLVEPDPTWRRERFANQIVWSAGASSGTAYFAAADQARDRLLWVVTDGPDFSGTALAAYQLFHALHSRGLAVVGDPQANNKSASPVLTAFLDGWGEAEVIRVRLDPLLQQPRLRVVGTLPDDFDLRALAQLIGEPEVEFVDSGPRLWLDLSPQALQAALLAAPAFAPVLEQFQLKDALTPATLRAATGGALRQAAPNSEAYVPPSLGELWMLREQVLAPMASLAAMRDTTTNLTLNPALRRAQGFAKALGYRYLLLNSASGQDLALVPSGTEPRALYWGSYLFRLGEAAPQVLEAPFDDPGQGLLEAAFDWYGRTRASALLVAGTHPLANRDGAADITRPSSRASLFNIAHKAALDRFDGAPVLVTQLRPAPVRLQAGTTDVVIAFQRGIEQRASWPAPTRDLLQRLDALGVPWSVHDGSAAYVGYESGVTAQSNYLETVPNASYATLYLSADRRRGYRAVGDPSELAAFAAVGMSDEILNLVTVHAGRRLALRPLPASAQALVQRYIASHDVQLLDQLVRRHAGWRWRHLTDSSSGVSLLAAFDREDRLAYAANLHPLSDRVLSLRAGAVLASEDIQALVARHVAALVVSTP